MQLFHHQKNLILNVMDYMMDFTQASPINAKSIITAYLVPVTIFFVPIILPLTKKHLFANMYRK